MARPVEYDLEDVLNKAMDIFWQKGYHNVSMAQLVDYTGLNRRTMYTLFKDKEGLFKDALDHYYTKRSIQKLEILKNNPGKVGIELFFNSFNDFNKNFKGCLFSNTIREKELLDKSTYDIPKEYFNKICSQLEINLTQAKQNGDFNGDSKTMAKTLITFIHGYHVHGKYNSSKEDSMAIKKNILKMIQ